MKTKRGEILAERRKEIVASGVKLESLEEINGELKKERADGMNHYQKWLAEIEDSPARAPTLEPKKERADKMKKAQKCEVVYVFPIYVQCVTRNIAEIYRKRLIDDGNHAGLIKRIKTKERKTNGKS